MEGPPPLRAMQSRDGDWLVLDPPHVRLFREMEEKLVGKTEWHTIGIGFLRSDPLVSVQPFRTVPGKPRIVTADPPLVLRWTGKEWEPFITEPLPPGTRSPVDVSVRQHKMVHLLGDSRGTLWVANEKFYRVRRFSAGGRLLTELALGPQKLLPRSDAAQVQKRLEGAAKDWSAPPGGSVAAQAAVARDVIEAVAEGRDGKIYLLVNQPWEGGDFVLDRFDPLTQELERAFVRLRENAWLTMAAGKDALYLAAAEPVRGPWKLDWSEIEAAAWERVEGARIDSHEMPQSASETNEQRPPA